MGQKFVGAKCFEQSYFHVRKKLCHKILVLKKFGLKYMSSFFVKANFGLKNSVQKILSAKQIWVLKNLGSKNV